MMSLESELVKESTSSSSLFESVSTMLVYVSNTSVVAYTRQLSSRLSTLVFGDSLKYEAPDRYTRMTPSSRDFIGPRLSYAQQLLHDILNMEPQVRVSKEIKSFSDANKPIS